MHDQLGLTVAEIQPVGLESSAGSTPLRLRVEGGPDEYLFAKLYIKGHLRADRWYKLGRTILYGSLEDEHPFQTVRRLVEYEVYALRLPQDIGVRTARPYGFVEITPEREYLLVTEFFKATTDRRILARASARPCTGSNAQNSQLWSPGGWPPAEYMFTSQSAAIRLGLSGACPQLNRRLGPWMVSLAVLLSSPLKASRAT